MIAESLLQRIDGASKVLTLRNLHPARRSQKLLFGLFSPLSAGDVEIKRKRIRFTSISPADRVRVCHRHVVCYEYCVVFEFAFIHRCTWTLFGI